MSLVIRIAVNDGPPVALVTAQRTQGGMDPDDINLYEVVRYEPDLRRNMTEVDTGVVYHCYGDGAVVLARKALEVVT